MTGRTLYAKSPQGVKRGATPEARRAATVEFGRESFRLTCRRRRGDVTLPSLTLDGIVTGFDWTRDGAVMTGSVQLIDPTLRRLPGLVAKGDVVRCEVRAQPGGAWAPLWEMTVTSADRAIQSRTSDVQLQATLTPAQNSRHSWDFRRDRAHPAGWTADEVTRAAARRVGVQVGDLPRGKHRMVKIVNKSGSMPEVVTAVWQRERVATGRRFDVSTARGVIDVREVRRPHYMLRLGPALLDAVLDTTVAAGFASAVVVTSTVKRAGSKARRKLRVLVVDRARVARYGYVRRTVSVAGLDAEAEARRYGQRWLARVAQPWTQITLTHDGIPWVQRGDGIRLNLPVEGLTADVYLLSAHHIVSYGAYTMELVATVTDPYADDERAARVRAKKAAAARQRAKSATKSPRRTPRKAAVRT